MSQRRRYKGSASDIAELLRPFVEHPWWLRYSEESKAPVKPQLLNSHKAMISECRAACPNLSFMKRQTTDAFRLLLREHYDDWTLKPCEREPWAQVQTSRFRCMMRHVSQSIHKNRGKGGPAWLRDLLSNGRHRKELPRG